VSLEGSTIGSGFFQTASDNGVTLTANTGHFGACTITTSSIGTNISVQENLRVVEYIKQSKIIRVELQRYNANIDDWETIPRIKIEE
jgi:hypothetical protein